MYITKLFNFLTYTRITTVGFYCVPFMERDLAMKQLVYFGGPQGYVTGNLSPLLNGSEVRNQTKSTPKDPHEGYKKVCVPCVD